MSKAKNVGLIILIAIVGVFQVLPIVFLICNSFMGGGEIQSTYGIIRNNSTVSPDYVHITLMPQEVTLRQFYEVLIRRPDFLHLFWNSCFITFPIIIGVAIVSTLGGYAFAKFDFAFKHAIFFVYIIIIMLPYQLMMVPNFIVIGKLNLINSRLSVILPAIFSPFGVFLLSQFMRKIPDEVLESARIDGINEVGLFLRIIVPLSKSGIASLLILTLIDTWSMVEQPTIFLDVVKYPLSVALMIFNQTNPETMFICGVIFLLPMLLFFLWGEDSLVEGISNSVIRGDAHA